MERNKQMKHLRLNFLLFCALITMGPFTQAIAQNCSVKDPNISGSYEGDCRRGKAHGEGIAKGKDTYEGEFRKGEKHGQGTYTYQNGNIFKGEFEEDQRYGFGKFVSATDSTQNKEGFWKGKNFMGKNKESLKGYKIIVAQNVNEPSFSKGKGDENKLTITVRDINKGIKNLSISDYGAARPQQVQYFSSGDSGSGTAILPVLDINYPFEATISYSVPNKSNNFDLPVILRIQIIEPGDWKMNVNH